MWGNLSSEYCSSSSYGFLPAIDFENLTYSACFHFCQLQNLFLYILVFNKRTGRNSHCHYFKQYAFARGRVLMTFENVVRVVYVFVQYFLCFICDLFFRNAIHFLCMCKEWVTYTLKKVNRSHSSFHFLFPVGLWFHQLMSCINTHTAVDDGLLYVTLVLSVSRLTWSYIFVVCAAGVIITT